ncbi:tautomerase family protein [Methylopila sp. 73B]|uniref:tautomerase family protein n=1 Tax=Methylopila sp. 73B TaxID=1120792 RepID=UPI00036FF423|nr:tautomerase family protein [Methylopila sp. 73B]
MPLVRVSLLKGRSAAAKRAIADGVYEALRAVFSVPQDDKFVVFHEHDADGFIFEPSYLGVAHDEGLVILQIAISDGRTVELKRAFYRSVVERLQADPGVEPRNVFINLIEVRKENWSFGDGVAQYV